jgi:hypothetical protein
VGGPEQVSALRSALGSLANQSVTRLAIHDLPFVQAQSGIQLVALSTTDERGVVPLPVKGAFEWMLKPSSWENVSFLLEPFVDRAVGFQFLDDCGLTVIYSADGKW